jgi:hypothetical protein
MSAAEEPAANLHAVPDHSAIAVLEDRGDAWIAHSKLSKV